MREGGDRKAVRLRAEIEYPTPSGWKSFVSDHATYIAFLAYLLVPLSTVRSSQGRHVGDQLPRNTMPDGGGS